MSAIENPHKIFVGNIPRDASEDDVEKLFRGVGKIIGFEFKGDYAFVEYDDSYVADEAIKDIFFVVINCHFIFIESYL